MEDNRDIKTQTPLASICCLTYNQENYIRQTLESLLMQRTSFSYEIIVHDDASTDGTRKIIESYAAEFPDIIKPIFQEENRYSLYGINFQFKYVFSKAVGKYVAMCAGDDFWIDPLKLQKQVDFLEKNPDYGVVHTKAARFIESKTRFEGTHGFEVDNFEELLTENTIATLTACLRNSLLKQYLKEVNPELKIKWTAEDFPMWLWFINHSKIRFLDEITCVYRVHGKSISHNKDGLKRLHFAEGIYAIVDHYLNEYPIVKCEKKIRARYYSNMISMFFLNKRWDGITKSMKIFYEANDWLNLLWIIMTLPFYYSKFFIKGSYRIRSEIFNLFNIYPIRK